MLYVYWSFAFSLLQIVTYFAHLPICLFFINLQELCVTEKQHFFFLSSVLQIFSLPFVVRCFVVFHKICTYSCSSLEYRIFPLILTSIGMNINLGALQVFKGIISKDIQDINGSLIGTIRSLHHHLVQQGNQPSLLGH